MSDTDLQQFVAAMRAEIAPAMVQINKLWRRVQLQSQQQGTQQTTIVVPPGTSGSTLPAGALSGSAPPSTVAQGAPGDGQVPTVTVGPPTLANPTDPPILSATGTGSGYAAGTYTAGYTWMAANGGQTALSPTATITITAGQNITMTVPTLPAGAVKTIPYISAAGGSTLLALVASASSNTTLTLTSVPSGTSAVPPPATNQSGGVTLTYVSPTLAADVDVIQTNPADGNLLTYDATAGLWVNKPPAFPNPMAHVGDVIYGGAGGGGLALAIDALNKVLTVGIGAPYLTPPAAPVPTTLTSGGTVAAGVYDVITTYTNAQGETTGSVAGSVTTTGSTSTVTVPSPPAEGTDSLKATGWNAYVTQVGGSTYTLQNGSPVAIGTPFTLTAPPTSSGANPLGSNTAASIVPVWGAAAPAPTIYGPLMDGPSDALLLTALGDCILAPD